MRLVWCVLLCAVHALESCSPNSSSFCWSGVFTSSSLAVIDSRILPISVLVPVATTTPRHLPDAMFVP